ncbi:MAG: T9SS type A sorting domain-containing protein [Bacteroidia bacterium]|nr:T9SS type A sorting domain-containing protein [Bacteroidia bacterium]
MKTQLLSFFTCAVFSASLSAQTWIQQGAGIVGSSLFIGDISAVNDTVAWAIAGSYNGGMCETPVTRFTRTSDGGAHWRSGSISAPSSYNTWNICAIDSLTAWVSTFDQFSLSNGRVYKTINGGQTWIHQATATFTSACKFVHFFNANEGVAVGQNEIFTTQNGGTNWVQQTDLPVPFPASTHFIINSYEVLGNKIWLGDYAGVVYYSADKGQTWTVKSGQSGGLGYTGIKALAFKDSLNGIAISSVFQGGGSGGGAYTDNAMFYKTNDGGATWTSAYYNSSQWTLANQYYAKYDVCYIPGTTNSYILSSEYAGFNKFSAITSDGGQTWTYIDSTIAHTALDFVSGGTGWSGSYINNVSDGIYKWGAATPTLVTSITDHQKQLNDQMKILYDQDAVFVSMEKIQATALTILNLEGKVIAVLNVDNAQKQRLDSESLARGAYILEAKVGNTMLHKKFIIE